MLVWDPVLSTPITPPYTILFSWVNKNLLISVLPEIFQPQLGNTIKIMIDRKYAASHLRCHLQDKNSKIAKSEWCNREKDIINEIIKKKLPKDKLK